MEQTTTVTSTTTTATLRMIPLTPSYSPNMASVTWDEALTNLSDETVLVNMYQSTYRSTTQYVQSYVLQPLHAVAAGGVLGSYISRLCARIGIGGDLRVALGLTTHLYPLYGALKCVLHLLFRCLPAWAAAKFLNLLG